MRSRYSSLLALPLAAASACLPAPKSCAGLTLPPLPAGSDFRLLTITSNEAINVTVPFNPDETPLPKPLSFCNVTVTLTHSGAADNVYIYLWLPLNNNKGSFPSSWNGRYLATGGGGLAAGFTGSKLAIPVSQGYATSSTDAGLTLNNTVSPQMGTWAINPDGTPNTGLQLNLLWRSVHDMAVVSKALVSQYYGRAHQHAYYSGCSQGGRQGYASAAQYPNDFDGVMANAPALSSGQFALADYWAPLLMNQKEVVPACVLDAFQDDIISHCDGLDGAKDGLLSDWRVVDAGCPTYDASKLVGKKIACTENGVSSTITVTPVYADIVAKILDGPKTPDGKSLWAGLAPGAAFSTTAFTSLLPSGVRTVSPFFVSQVFIQAILFKDPSYNVTKMSFADYYRAWDIAAKEYTPTFSDARISDLSGFQKSGAKLLTYQGLADDIIPPQGVFRYREGVEKALGGKDKVDGFYRLFLAPGLGHCEGGRGPQPVDPLSVLVDWVEKGKVPDTMKGKSVKGGVEVTRDWCRFPKKAVYTGGDLNKAESFVCR